MPKDDKKKEVDVLEGCPVDVPKIDEGELLADIRSPNFLEACKKVRIDPIDLKPRPFDSFKVKGEEGTDKQQVRFAMFERGRFMKWKALKDAMAKIPHTAGSHNDRLSMTTGGIPVTKKGVKGVIGGTKTVLRSLSAMGGGDLSNTRLGEMMSKTGDAVSRGQVEVFKSVSKPLKDVIYEGKFVLKKAQEDEKAKLDAKIQAEHRRKELIRKHAEEEKKKKERDKQERERKAEIEAKFKEKDDAVKARNQELYEQWQAESLAKQQKQLNHFKKVQENAERNEEAKRERERQLFEEMERKAAAAEARRYVQASEDPNEVGMTFEEKAAAAAEKRRQEVTKNQAERAKVLAAEHRKQQLAVERREQERVEKVKEIERKRKEREAEHRKRIADIQRQKRDNMKQREDAIMEHMQKVEESLERNKEEREKELALKAEIEKLKREQAFENVRREKERQQWEAANLDAKHKQRVNLQNTRDTLLEELLKERAVHATEIRLHKDQIKEEIFNIKCFNSWNRANQLLKELEPKSGF